jgi:predicted Zn-dependent peptidase
MKQDRLLFDKRELPNGITVYLYPYDVPFGESIVVFPYGSGHNTGDILPGTFHFLEHRVCEKSKAFPDPLSFSSRIKLRGGYFNATTSTLATRYYMDSSEEHFSQDFSDLIDHLTTTEFDEPSVAKERSIIRNERKRTEKYHPGGNEVDHYLRTKWTYRGVTSIVQQLGADSDLEQTTAQYLRQIYDSYYFTKDMVVFIGGSYDEEKILTKIASIQTKETITLPLYFNKTEWVNKEYRKVHFHGAKRIDYHYGVLIPLSDIKTATLCAFLGGLYGNTTNGALFHWLRHELNESYSISISTIRNMDKVFFSITIPFSSESRVELVRNEIKKRMRDALTDENRITTEAKRVRSQDAFLFQKLSEILNSAQSQIEINGKIYTEQELHDLLDEVANSKSLLEFFDTYFNEQATGEILVVPKEYSKLEQKIMEFGKKYIFRTE